MIRPAGFRWICRWVSYGPAVLRAKTGYVSMISEPHWTAYLSSLLTPVIAAIGLFIAYWQWKTARDKLKNDLFDRRYSIFEETRALCDSIWLYERQNEAGVKKLSLTSLEAKWLFSDKVAAYINEIHRKTAKIDILNFELDEFKRQYPLSEYYSAKLKDVPEKDREKIFALREERDRLIEWFYNQEPVFDELFSPYLSLRH